MSLLTGLLPDVRTASPHRAVTGGLGSSLANLGNRSHKIRHFPRWGRRDRRPTVVAISGPAGGGPVLSL